LNAVVDMILAQQAVSAMLLVQQLERALQNGSGEAVEAVPARPVGNGRLADDTTLADPHGGFDRRVAGGAGQAESLRKRKIGVAFVAPSMANTIQPNLRHTSSAI
jgi:hypothetical protein